jgi:ribonuclease P protein component
MDTSSLGHGALATRDQFNGLVTHETPISTVENPPQAAARFPESQLEQEWAGYSSESPAGGSQTPDSRVNLTGVMSDSAPAKKGLTRSMRLRHKADFSRIRLEGKRLSKGCLVANWLALPPEAHPKLGVITSRKLGKAHIRSRARRLLRETFRLHQYDLREPVAMVLVARTSIVGRKLVDVERDFLSLLRQARLLKDIQ